MGFRGLEKQNISIPLGSGMDTKTDEKQVQVGKLLYLKNAVLDKLLKIIKRPGFGLVSTGTTGNAIATFKDELLRFDGESVESFSEFDSNFYNKGQKIACSLSVNSVVSNIYEQTNADSTIHPNGFKVFAWTDSSGGVLYSVLDSGTNQSVVSSQVVDVDGSRAKVISLGDYVIIFYVKNGTSLCYRVINSSSTSLIGSSVTIGTVTQSAYDVTLSSGAVIAYSDGSNTTSIKRLSSSLVLSSVYAVNQAVGRVSLFTDSAANVWVAFLNSALNSVGYFIVNPGLSSTILAPTTVSNSATYSNVIGFYSASSGVIVYETSSDSESNHFLSKANVSSSGTVTNNDQIIRSIGLFSKAFSKNSNYYFVVTHESELQSSYFVIDSLGKVIAKLAPSSGGGLRSDGVLCEINTESEDTFQFAYLVKDFVTSVEGKVTTQTGVNSAELKFGTPIISVGIGDNILSSGAKPTMYDGQNVVEQGFNLYPEGITTEVTNGGGGLSQGKYQISSVYEWTDNQGQIHRSAPSVPETIDTTLSAFYSSGTMSGGAFTPDTSNFGDRSKIGPGMKVSGPGITGDSYMVFNETTGSLAATGAPSGTGIYKFSSGKSFNGSTTIGSSLVEVKKNTGEYYLMGLVSGSNIATLATYQPIKLGSSVALYINGGSNFVATLVAQNGKTLTLDTPSTFTAKNVFSLTFFNFQATISNGSAVMTGISTAKTQYIQPGDVIYFASTGGNRTVLSKTSTTVTVDIAWASNSTITWTIYQNRRFPEIGEVYSNLNAGFSGSVSIESIGATSVTVNDQAIATVATDAFITDAAATGTYTIPTLRVTDKKGSSKVSIAVYRTLVNQSVFYRVSSFESPIFNDTLIDSVSFVDTTPDSILVGNELLYTTGGVIENIAPPSFDSAFIYKTRVCLVPSESPSQLWYSKPVVSGTAIEMSDSFVINTPEKGGSIIGGGQLDDKLIQFKEGLIYFNYGDGPNNTGLSSDFGEPQVVPSDVGCVDQKSIVSTPFGLIFKSEKGLYLLDRSLQVKPIGAEMQEFNDLTITSAQKIPNKDRILFTTKDEITIVYDYMAGCWSVFEEGSVSDASIFEGKITLLTPDGLILKEFDEFTDNGSFVPIGLETSWLSFAGLQGFQRVYKMLILGQYKSPHSLKIDVAYDFEESYTQSEVIPVPTAPSGQYQFEVRFNRQKCEAIKIKITELQTAPFGEGLNLSSISLEVGAKRGLNKKSTSSTYG